MLNRFLLAFRIVNIRFGVSDVMYYDVVTFFKSVQGYDDLVDGCPSLPVVVSVCVGDIDIESVVCHVLVLRVCRLCWDRTSLSRLPFQRLIRARG